MPPLADRAARTQEVATVPSEQHEQVVALLSAARADRAVDDSWEAARAGLDALAGVFPVPEGVTVTPGEIGGVPCERVEPRAGHEPGVVLYLHGGAYTAGSLTSHRNTVGRIALACRRPVVAVDYRLAPEHPLPAGVHDAAAAYRALLDEVAAGEVVVAGDSAGGGLAAALLVHLRDEGAPLPAGAVLLSPWVDLTMELPAVAEVGDADPLLDVDRLRRSAAAYAGDDLRAPLASPVFADLTGLPPLLVLVGTREILLDDSRVLAERARAVGVDVELDVEEGLVHVWPVLDGIPESVAAMTRIATWVDARLTA